MKVVIQRCKKASVEVDGKLISKIDEGMLLLVGIGKGDTLEDVKRLAEKILYLRIFSDEKGLMNKNINDVKGSILAISQFTLYADTKKGNRPSYVNSMKASDASHLYDLFNEELKKYNVEVQTGIFQADMLVNINNDGPVTIILES